MPESPLVAGRVEAGQPLLRRGGNAAAGTVYLMEVPHDSGITATGRGWMVHCPRPGEPAPVEALRAFFVDGLTYEQAGERFGYTRWAIVNLVREHRGNVEPGTPARRSAGRLRPRPDGHPTEANRSLTSSPAIETGCEAGDGVVPARPIAVLAR
jgi:hypothetical protein